MTTQTYPPHPPQHFATARPHYARACAKLDVELVEFNGEADHVHLLVAYPRLHGADPADR